MGSLPRKAAWQSLFKFHAEKKIEEAKQRRVPEQIAFIPEENDALAGFGEVNLELVKELRRRCPEQRIATVDLDATIIESHKQHALRRRFTECARHGRWLWQALSCRIRPLHAAQW